MSAILFPYGVRLSTLLALAAFAAVALVRDDRRAPLAGAAWLTGFEAVFQTVQIAMGKPLPGFGIAGPLSLIALGAVTLILTRSKVTADGRILAATLLVMAVWIASGFHANAHSAVGFDPFAEVLNETAKTLWAIAYLLPLLRHADKPTETRIAYASSVPPSR